MLLLSAAFTLIPSIACCHLQAPHTADKKVVVLPEEITRDDVRIIMWNILDIYGATQTEKSLIARSTVNMLKVSSLVVSAGRNF